MSLFLFRLLGDNGTEFLAEAVQLLKLDKPANQVLEVCIKIDHLPLKYWVYSSL
jgi:hypothetical protein